MSTAYILTCSPRVNGSSDAIARLLAQGLQQEGIQPEILPVRDFRIRPCISCGHCTRHPGMCVLDAGDDAGTLFARLLQADTLLFAIPVYFYGPPAYFKGFVDRAQKFWSLNAGTAQQTASRTTCVVKQNRLAQAVFCAARTDGARLFEANQLILRCFLNALGFRLEEPLLLRGVEQPEDLEESRNPQHIALTVEMGRAAARFVHASAKSCTA